MKELNVKRIEWIDVCKGLGIFLVFIGHTNVSQLSCTLYDWIYSFHMPLFYMLSGSGIIRLLLSFVVLTYLCRFINKYMSVVLGR